MLQGTPKCVDQNISKPWFQLVSIGFEQLCATPWCTAPRGSMDPVVLAPAMTLPHTSPSLDSDVEPWWQLLLVLNGETVVGNG